MRKKSKGFSLLEIMLVLVLLGGVATLAIGVLPGKPAAQHHEEQLGASLQWAADRAVQEGQVYGLAVASREWQIVKLVRTPNGEHPSYIWPGHIWQPVDSRGTAKAHQLPEGTSLQLLLEGHEQPLSPLLQQQGMEPRILLMPGGEVSRFELRLLTENHPPRIIDLAPGSIR
jgi:general secretion pathway protein H